jgi:hypothetical protein
MTEIMGVPLYDDDVFKLLFRFAHNVAFLALVIRYGLKARNGDRKFAFAAVMLNITIFFICFTMKKLDISLGMALGLFAIFGVLRYRGTNLSPRELTYLFVVIGIAVINALTNKKTSYLELLVVNIVIFTAAILKEYLVSRPMPDAVNTEKKISVVYDNLELLKPMRRPELLDDLSQRFGLSAYRCEIKSVDIPSSQATLNVWCETGRKV